MNGIDKITGKISDDIQKEIDAIDAAARSEAEAIAGRYDTLVRQESEAAEERSRRSAAERKERLASVAQLEARKLTLAAKREMLERAYDRALKDLCALSDEEYISLLSALAVKAARTGREKVIFSQKDRSRVGKAVVTRANEVLAKRVAPKLPDEISETKAGALLDKVVTSASALFAGTGMLTLSEETRPIQGGLILSDGEVETNCTFETLIRLQKGAMDLELAEILFA